MLVAGVDSSSQGCKVLIVESDTGRTVRSAKLLHPDGTEIDPNVWWDTLVATIKDAGGLDNVKAVSIAGQQHGMILLDRDGKVVRDALMWNDTRSADAAAQLISELGAEFFAQETGVVPVASFTVSKLRWVRDHEPENCRRTAAVCLPHDYLTWRLRGYGPDSPQGADLEQLITDRSDVSGTAYWGLDGYKNNIFEHAFGRSLREAGSPGSESAVIVPKVLLPGQHVTSIDKSLIIGPGAGDNAAAALGLSCLPGDAVVSLGTSGAVFGSSSHRVFDPSGTVAGFCDANGEQLPLICTLNGAKILDTGAKLLGCTHHELADLALAAKPGADGLVLVPYFQGERTPNRPTAKARLENMTLANSTRENIARAFVEALLCSMAFGLSAIEKATSTKYERLVLIGGASVNHAVQECARHVFGLPIVVPAAVEYVARGAALQAAWALYQKKPSWPLELIDTLEPDCIPEVYQQYQSAAQNI